ncbi:MAG: hypothetical protein OIF50_07785 [Flavobacteriaceae bacterium]|nr:hypothetical protein [Flavobacteriaceae bacterium]
MSDIISVYHNEFGMGFRWKAKQDDQRMQLIFRDMGFYLTHQEIQTFLKRTEYSLQNLHCGSCPNQAHCRSYLLQTPMQYVDLAMSESELHQLKNLLEGCLFYDRFENEVEQILKK